MPFIRDNRLAALLTEAHQRGADETRSDLEARLNEHIRTVGRRNAELCAEKTELERRLAAAERQLADRDQTIAYQWGEIRSLRAEADRACGEIVRMRRSINQAVTDDPKARSVSLVKRGPA